MKNQQKFIERGNRVDPFVSAEERLKLMVQNTPVAMIDWDIKFQVSSWNPAAERILGYTKEEAIGKHANFIIPEKIRPFVDDVWKKLLAGEITEVTNENITKNGKTVTCEWHNTPLTSSDGQVFGVSSMLLDVTERVKLEEERKEHIEEIQKMNKLMVGRELKMAELKKEIEDFKKDNESNQ